MAERVLLALVMMMAGAAFGLIATVGIWEMVNPNHAPETGATGGMWGLMLGAPAGGAVGLAVGTILALRWSRHSGN
jgi:multisubunit Na+/H+ antiporter MnhG subunit